MHSRMILMVHSRTCVMLPGAEPISAWLIVWIESMITISGFTLSAAVIMLSRSVSAKT